MPEHLPVCSSVAGSIAQRRCPHQNEPTRLDPTSFNSVLPVPLCSPCHPTPPPCPHQVPGWDAAVLACSAAAAELTPPAVLGSYLAVQHLPLLLLTGEARGRGGGGARHLVNACIIAACTCPCLC